MIVVKVRSVIVHMLFTLQRNGECVEHLWVAFSAAAQKQTGRLRRLLCCQRRADVVSHQPGVTTVGPHGPSHAALAGATKDLSMCSAASITTQLLLPLTVLPAVKHVGQLFAQFSGRTPDTPDAFPVPHP
jgi:hypothetical protein